MKMSERKPRSMADVLRSAEQDKVKKVMHEFKHGGLHSGSKHGPKVTNRKQAIAIGLSEARRNPYK